MKENYLPDYLKTKSILYYVGWPDVVTRILKNRRGWMKIIKILNFVPQKT
jgi:hypothetical protein